jgi:hypothetical protein
MYNSNFFKVDDIDNEFEKFGNKMKQKILQRKQKTRDKLANYENRNISENSENNTVEKDNKLNKFFLTYYSIKKRKFNIIK